MGIPDPASLVAVVVYRKVLGLQSHNLMGAGLVSVVGSNYVNYMDCEVLMSRCGGPCPWSCQGS